MADWKRQVGALNAMGRTHAKLADIKLVRQSKAERIARLVERMKEKQGG